MGTSSPPAITATTYDRLGADNGAGTILMAAVSLIDIDMMSSVILSRGRWAVELALVGGGLSLR